MKLIKKPSHYCYKCSNKAWRLEYRRYGTKYENLNLFWCDYCRIIRPEAETNVTTPLKHTMGTKNYQREIVEYVET